MAQKGKVDTNLEKLLTHFAELAQQSFEKRTNNDAVSWFRPPLDEWDGDTQTEDGLKNLHKAFNTDDAEEALIDAYKLEDPGNSSDGILLSLQIDYAAQAERAYRSRVSHTFPRILAHYSSREKGHGQQNGIFLGQALEYFRSVMKQGSEGTGGSV